MNEYKDDLNTLNGIRQKIREINALMSGNEERRMFWEDKPAMYRIHWAITFIALELTTSDMLQALDIAMKGE